MSEITIISKLCQCYMVVKGDGKTHQFNCQQKVHENLMTMKEYYEICQDMPPLVEVTSEEQARLEKLWNGKGYKYVVNDKTGVVTFV